MLLRDNRTKIRKEDKKLRFQNNEKAVERRCPSAFENNPREMFLISAVKQLKKAAEWEAMCQTREAALFWMHPKREMETSI